MWQSLTVLRGRATLPRTGQGLSRWSVVRIDQEGPVARRVHRPTPNLAYAHYRRLIALGRLSSIFQQVDQLNITVHLYGWGGAAIDPGFTLTPQKTSSARSFAWTARTRS